MVYSYDLDELEEVPGHTWSMLFDAPDSDIVVRSSSPFPGEKTIYSFGVHKAKLANSSVLKDILEASPSNIKPADKHTDGIPILYLPEDGITLNALLQFLYNGEHYLEDFASLKEWIICPIYEACVKYNMQVARLAIEYAIRLNFKTYSVKGALQIYKIALACDALQLHCGCIEAISKVPQHKWDKDVLAAIPKDDLERIVKRRTERLLKQDRGGK